MSAYTLHTGERVALRKRDRMIEAYRAPVIVVPLVDRRDESEVRQYVECVHGVGLARRCGECEYVYEKFEEGL